MSGRTIGARVAAAQAEAMVARARLGGTIAALKQRVSPQALAQDAAETLKGKGLALASDLADQAQRRPGVVAAIVGGIALVLGRNRILRLVRRATYSPPESLPSKPLPKQGPAR